MAPSPLDAPPEAEKKFDLLRSLDPFAGLRAGLGKIADAKELWAGIPMPLDGRRMVIEPKFPHGEVLAAFGISTEARAQEEERERDWHKLGIKERSRFWSFYRKAYVITYTDSDGKVRHCLDHGWRHGMRLLDTMMCSSAWGIEQEHRAVQLLGTMLSHHHFKCYLLTGSFIERSAKTNLVYVFRRLRPTVVLYTGHADNEVRIRCALCMHPIGYYEKTWAGVMCPTDEVIAHLALMRGDEAMLWRRANQHPPWAPEAGI